MAKKFALENTILKSSKYFVFVYILYCGPSYTKKEMQNAAQPLKLANPKKLGGALFSLNSLKLPPLFNMSYVLLSEKKCIFYAAHIARCR